MHLKANSPAVAHHGKTVIGFNWIGGKELEGDLPSFDAKSAVDSMAVLENGTASTWSAGGCSADAPFELEHPDVPMHSKTTVPSGNRYLPIFIALAPINGAGSPPRLGGRSTKSNDAGV